MSWTYGNDPANDDTDACRYFIGDTDSTDPLVTDEEIEFQLQLADGNYFNASAELAEALAAKFARYATIKTADVTVDYSARAQMYTAMAEKLRAGAAAKSGIRLYAGGISLSDKQTVDLNMDRPRPAFRRDVWPEERQTWTISPVEPWG